MRACKCGRHFWHYLARRWYELASRGMVPVDAPLPECCR